MSSLLTTSRSASARTAGSSRYSTGNGSAGVSSARSEATTWAVRRSSASILARWARRVASRAAVSGAASTARISGSGMSSSRSLRIRCARSTWSVP
ncbi:Uncharacterised protein [Mycobacteroides abscessus subsp. abscessus]|nr:Uncharacterised protein [Mycobacteroides abscessus subsp. abscessus]